MKTSMSIQERFVLQPVFGSRSCAVVYVVPCVHALLRWKVPVFNLKEVTMKYRRWRSPMRYTSWNMEIERLDEMRKPGPLTRRRVGTCPPSVSSPWLLAEIRGVSLMGGSWGCLPALCDVHDHGVRQTPETEGSISTRDTGAEMRHEPARGADKIPFRRDLHAL
ncbi:hypothetical protein VUR80DRAFT_9873 [Thermomyces stellatus]